MSPKPITNRAFTLVELLVVIAIVALLIGVLLPGLAGARRAAHEARCLANQRQLVAAWTMYAGEHRGLAMPARIDSGDARRTYWWGAEDLEARRIDHGSGVLSGMLDEAALGAGSVFECPSQARGTYAPQSQLGPVLGEDALTSTYGYNAYGLAPPSAGYDAIRHQRWLRLDEIGRPDAQAVFADAMIAFGPTLKNTALLDPPELFDSRGRWRTNRSPTTAFRHAGRSAVATADASVSAREPGTEVDIHGLGALSEEVGPWYVQDADRWRASGSW
ncbi:MAG: type II secretion system protein [Phycisphaerales bacterium JB040]